MAPSDVRDAALQALLARLDATQDLRDGIVPTKPFDPVILVSAEQCVAYSVALVCCPGLERTQEDVLSAAVTEELRIALQDDDIEDITVMLAFYDRIAAEIPQATTERTAIVERLRRLIRSQPPTRTPVVHDALAMARMNVRCVDAVLVAQGTELAVVRVGTPRDRTLQWLQRAVDDVAWTFEEAAGRSAAQLRQSLPECPLVGRWLLLTHVGDTVDACSGLRIWFRGFDRVFLFATSGEGLERIVELDDREKAGLA